MAWGAAAQRGTADLAERVARNDPGLQSLSILRFRRFNDDDVRELADALASSGNTTLQELNAVSHGLSAAAAAALGAALATNRGLRRLNVGTSALGNGGLAALCEGGLERNEALVELDLEARGLSGADGCRALARVLQRHPTLERLTLARNAALGDAGVVALCGGGADGGGGGGGAGWRGLKSLQLAECGLRGPVALEALARSGAADGLTHLCLANNDLGGGGGAAAAAAAVALAEVVRAAPRLASLGLAGTGLGCAGLAEGLASALREGAAPALASLDYGDAGLGPEGVAALAAALAGRAAPPLARLSLAGNRGADDASLAALARALAGAAAAAVDGGSVAAGGDAGGAAAAAAAAAAAPRGPSLDLSLSGVGAQTIEALAAHPSLETLSLFGNKQLGGGSGSDAWHALLRSLSGGENGSSSSSSGGGFAALRELTLTGCDLQEAQLVALLAALRGRPGVLPALKTLEVAANPGALADGFEAALAALREARPGLDVCWKAADGGQQQQQQEE